MHREVVTENCRQRVVADIEANKALTPVMEKLFNNVRSFGKCISSIFVPQQVIT